MNEALAKDYAARCAGRIDNHVDIQEHLPTLSQFASACQTVVEFGVRTGHSTTALLHGLEQAANPAELISFDLEAPAFTCPPLENVKWTFTRADTSALATIPECDLLFIDTLHTSAQVQAELRHAHRVRHWIFFHDTITWGTVGERGQPGITDAIYQFLAAHGADWRVHRHWPNCNGLLCLCRISPLLRGRPFPSPYLFTD